jgi:hypothetical protein
MPHPSKIKLPDWLESDENWISTVDSCDTSIKFSSLFNDILKEKVFESRDQLCMIIYLIAGDIQEKHEINISSQLDDYTSILYTKPFHFHSLWRHCFAIHNKNDYECKYLEKEKKCKSEQKNCSSPYIIDEDLGKEKKSKSEQENCSTFYITDEDLEKEKKSKSEQENCSPSHNSDEDSTSDSSEFDIICDSDCYYSDSSDSSEIGDYTEMDHINEKSTDTDCEKNSDLDSSDDFEIIFE